MMLNSGDLFVLGHFSLVWNIQIMCQFPWGPRPRQLPEEYTHEWNFLGSSSGPVHLDHSRLTVCETQQAPSFHTLRVSGCTRDTVSMAQSTPQPWVGCIKKTRPNPSIVSGQTGAYSLNVHLAKTSILIYTLQLEYLSESPESLDNSRLLIQKV